MFERKLPLSVTIAINHGRLESWSEGEDGDVLILATLRKSSGYCGKNTNAQWFVVNVSKKHLNRLNLRSSHLKDKVPSPEGFRNKIKKGVVSNGLQLDNAHGSTQKV